MTAMAELRLSSALDPAVIRTEFEREGRVHIPALLDESSAKAVRKALVDNKVWNLAFDHKGEHRSLDAAGMETLPREKRDEFLRIVHDQATSGFQYLFANFPVYEVFHRRTLPDHFFNRVFEFLNSEAFLGFARAATGLEDIGFADAQATRYGPGHFLTSHDDAVAGKNRLAAYVLNFTPDWRSDWGGLLQFIGDDGHVERAFTPAYNALNIFRVPTKHAVSVVAPFAGAHRYAITGWLRAGRDPGP